jgi:hypothetical protein
VDAVSRRFEEQKGELLRLRGCEELSKDLKEQVRRPPAPIRSPIPRGGWGFV